jgi:hypothetical protein
LDELFYWHNLEARMSIEQAWRELSTKGGRGYVYLARAETGHYKIGRSVRPDDRIKHFDTIMPIRVDTVHIFYADDYIDAEAGLHKLAEQFRTQGEWFELPQDYVDTIKAIVSYQNGRFYVNEQGTIEVVPPRKMCVSLYVSWDTWDRLKAEADEDGHTVVEHLSAVVENRFQDRGEDE